MDVKKIKYLSILFLIKKILIIIIKTIKLNNKLKIRYYNYNLGYIACVKLKLCFAFYLNKQL